MYVFIVYKQCGLLFRLHAVSFESWVRIVFRRFLLDKAHLPCHGSSSHFGNFNLISFFYYVLVSLSLASARSAKEVERCYNNSLNCYTIEIVSFSSACCCCCCCFFICFDSENGVKNNKNFVFQALIGLIFRRKREKCGIYTRWMVSACEISTHVLNLNRTIFFVHFLGQEKNSHIEQTTFFLVRERYFSFTIVLVTDCRCKCRLTSINVAMKCH